MAVYEQTYRRYTGEITPQRSRFLVLLRYAFQEVLASRLVLLLLILGGIVPLATAVLIYLHHNFTALTALNLPLDRLMPIDNLFFEVFVIVESSIGFFLALIVGPGLVAPDVRNNALPLYFSRPFSRAEYVLGKIGVLLSLLSALTWIPGLLLFLLQAGLEPAWVGPHLGLAWAIFAASVEWIVVLSLLTLAISAWVKWKPVARIVLLAVFFVMGGWGLAINAVLDTRWGNLVSLGKLNDSVRSSLFNRSQPDDLPVWAAWLALAAACLLFLSMLRRKLRAYEVVR
jgi:ABC-2 type transport system permease protein